MILVENLVKSYGTRNAVDDISFEVKQGEILGFLGPNGAGKTTTMRILTCFLPATSGRVSIGGHDVFEDSQEVRRRVGYLPENVPLYQDMTVEAYVAYMGKLKGMDRAALAARLDEVLVNCGLEHRRRDIIGKLSRGYRQRVGLAQALIHDPDVLILDEPTASLDPVQIREVREYIKNLAGNHTIILSTHILPEVELICDRVVVINNGRLVADDTPANLRNVAFRGQTRVNVEISGQVAAAIEAIQQVDAVTAVYPVQRGEGVASLEVDAAGDVRAAVARAVVESGAGLLRLDLGGRSLEDIFVKLTTEEAVSRPAVAEPVEAA